MVRCLPGRRTMRAALAASLGAWIAASGVVAPLAYGAESAATTAAPGTPAMAATASAPLAASAPDDTFLLTIFLRHDESKPLPKINDQLAAQGFFKTFPPPGIEVVSWYVMMGIGQVVTLRVPASRLREVNRAIETTAAVDIVHFASPLARGWYADQRRCESGGSGDWSAGQRM